MTCTRFETAGRTEESASTFREGVRHFGSCSIARRHENREQAPGEPSFLTRHAKIQVALGHSFEECPEAVCSAASVKSQQDVIVTVENRHPQRRCHKRRVPL